MRDLLFIETIYEVPHSEYESDTILFLTRVHELTVERSKSSSSPDKALTPRSISESKVTECYHRLKYGTYRCIANDRTSLSLSYALYNQYKLSPTDNSD
jgi:hypothetical protein